MVKRADPAAVWTAYREGYTVVRDWIAALPSEAWSAPSNLPGWSVADLAAHISMIADSVTRIAPAPRGVRAETVSDYLAAYGPAAGDIANAATQIAATATHRPDRIVAVVDERLEAASQTVETMGGRDPVVTTVRVPVHLGNYLLTRVIEVAVHAEDLALSLPGVEPPVLPRDTERLAVRALLDVLAQRAPGRSVEVRVPPHAAVQCVEGPRHTRGTPPNVAEMSPSTWLRLAAGRTTWAAEVAAGTLAASGARAELTPWLPLL